jgi:hypothetical protein
MQWMEYYAVVPTNCLKAIGHYRGLAKQCATFWSPLMLAMAVLGTSQARLAAQEMESKEQSALVDGLLDLLNEPAPSTKLPGQPAPQAEPAGKRSLGVAPTQSADNPLQAVRQGMLVAANHLSKGWVTPETRQLQGNIVTQLDELIQQLEQSQPSPPSAQPSPPQPSDSSASQPTQTESQSPSTSSASSQSSAPDRSQTDSQREPGQAEQNPDGPAQKGRATTATVDLADPKVLQQNVWGQLPEQVRKQMQSRMVERFLPSYRQQIEAYFQALLEDDPRGR